MGLFDALFGNRNQIPTVTTILPDAARQEIMAGRLPILNTDKLFLKRGEKIHFIDIVDLMKKRVNPSFYTLCRTAFNLTRGYQKLHAMGAKYQDISFGNLFFNPDNGDVLICDNDNVSFDNSKPGGPWYTGIYGTGDRPG